MNTNAAPTTTPPAPRGWGSLARTMRAPIAVLVFAAVGLLLPPQTRDMLAYLHGGSVWREAAFHLALMAMGLSAWHWGRAALAARFGADDTQYGRESLRPVVNLRAYTELPRLLLLGAAGLGVLMLVRSGIWSPVSFGILVVWAALLYFLLWSRLTWQAPLLGLNTSRYPPQSPRRAEVLGLGRATRERLRALFDRAPFGAGVGITLVGVSLLIFIAGTVESFVQPAWLDPVLAVRFALAFPGPAAALFGLGLMVGPLTVFTFLCDGVRFPKVFILRRPPALIGLAAWTFVLMPAVFDLHAVRVIDAPLRERATIGAFLQSWSASCFPGKATVRPVIVAVSGGATMAGIWGARVLHDVVDAGGIQAPAVFAVSSVSGGSLGTAAFMSLLAKHGNPCAEPAGEKRAERLGLAVLQSPQLAGDALGPLLNGWLLGDIPRAIFGAPASFFRWLNGTQPRGGDSAAAIEHGFEFLFSGVSAGQPSFADPFLSLFYVDGQQRPGMPLWIANGTDTTTGSRLLTVPIHAPEQADASAWPFGPAYDVLGLLSADVPISTALNNAARFPYLEPFGLVLPLDPKAPGTPHEVIDGGYFENEGLETALDLAAWLVREGPGLVGRAVEPIIVQATANGSNPLAPSDVIRCGEAGHGPLDPATSSAPQLFAPLIGIYSVRGGHSAVALRNARDGFCHTAGDGTRVARFFHFYLGATPLGEVPLNWVLSEPMAEAVWAAMDKDNGNSEELSSLRKTFRELAPPK